MGLVTSKAKVRPLYVYSQAFGKEWVTVGAYERAHEGEPAKFRYAPSYLEREDWVSIDPVNLPSTKAIESFVAPRYQGLHDVLRDACPDSWGRKLLIKYRGLPEKSTPLDFLKATANTDRWGALAAGDRAQASSAQIHTPKLADIEQVIHELHAIEKGMPAINQRLRDQMAQTGLGGARPKATVQDQEGAYWILKPQSTFDPPHTAQLEHFAQTWGRESGLNFAQTELKQLPSGVPAVLVKRFDREGGFRKMCLSAASALKYEFPSSAGKGGQMPSELLASYPRLAATMRLIGCLESDRQELFKRMVFNVICGNDDDHVRNHALIYDMGKRVWRLSPAYDVVPNQSGMLTHLGMGLSMMDKRITRENILSGHIEFGFENEAQALLAMEEIYECATHAFALNKDLLDQSSQEIIERHISHATRLLFDRWAHGSADSSAGETSPEPV
jgi:serine/threonine-protein kinase HipA